MAIGLGHGVIADRAGELVATGMWWPYGDSHATVGMIIVSPDHQGAGLGRRVMQELLAQAEGRSLLLYATVAGKPLYERLGFAPYGEVSQYQGEALQAAAPVLSDGMSLRAALPADMAEVKRLDRAASGLAREALLAALQEQGECVLLERAGKAVGFSILRRFGRGLVVGPVIADNDQDARTLVAHWLHGREGQFIRVDIRADASFANWLIERGLQPAGSVIAMVRGTLPVAPGAARLYALSNQALG